MHLTLLQDVANPPAHSMREQLKRLRRFQQLYNEERPHQALDNATPAERYQVSPRHFDGILRSPEYGDQEVRWVRHNGEIKLDGKFIYINSALTGEPVGLAESEHGWTVTYGPIMRHHRPSKRRITKTKEGPRGLGDNAARCRQVHSPNNNKPERNENCVTHVAGLKCYLCRRLLKATNGYGNLWRIEQQAQSGSHVNHATRRSP